jgi:cytochrome oxidase Cu insertion factor (SCO1/SenC/PrrC family)
MSRGVLALSVLISVTALVVYSQLTWVATIRNNPEGYLAAFAIATTLAGLAVALRRRWYAWTVLALSVLLLLGGAAFNFVLARVPTAATTLKIGERPADFTLPDASGRPVSLGPYRGVKPVVLVFYRGYW